MFHISVSWKGLEIVTISIVLNPSNSHVVVFKHDFSLKESRVSFQEMANSRCGAGNVQDNSVTLCTRNQGRYQRLLGLY